MSHMYLQKFEYRTKFKNSVWKHKIIKKVVQHKNSFKTNHNLYSLDTIQGFIQLGDDI